MNLAHQPYDFTLNGIINWLDRKKTNILKNQHLFIPERHATLGPHLATAHFVVARGGAVKFEGMDQWIEKDSKGKYDLPATFVEGLSLEAIEWTEAPVMFHSFDNFGRLPKDILVIILDNFKTPKFLNVEIFFNAILQNSVYSKKFSIYFHQLLSLTVYMGQMQIVH